MKSRLSNYAPILISWRILPILAWLVLFTGFLTAQTSFSAGPLLLHQVRTIYVAPSSDDLVLLIKARLEKWTAVTTASTPEDADAILICQTENTIVYTRVVVQRTIAEVMLVDHSSQRPIWKTRKFAAFDRTVLADEIMEQLKRDWRKSASEY